jgi:hypothetical protein
MIRNLSLVIVLAAAACGGKKTAPATTETTTTTTQQADPHDEHAAGEAGHHEALTPELTQFHDLLSPLWHAAKGPQRMKDTCAALPQLKTSADAVAKATPPTKTNADTWTSATRALADSVNRLETACKANDTAKFETALHDVHEAFHRLMEQASGGKHEAGKHEAGAGDHKH